MAVDLLIRALCELGHTVDLLTFHEGEARHYPGLTHHRIPAPPLLRNVRPGFSWKKLICDMVLAIKAWRLVRRIRPDQIHAVEEAAILVRFLRPWFRVPYTYDMDSSLPAQLMESNPWLKCFASILQWVERKTLQGAELIIPVCPSLGELAAANGGKNIHILQDISFRPKSLPPPSVASELTRLPGCRFLYVGNLEAYQGIDLLLRSFAIAATKEQNISLVLVGGNTHHVNTYRVLRDSLDISTKVYLLGPRPAKDLFAWLTGADVLLSPRIAGINTPMKIYSYLDSGSPVLATRLETHTQVLNENIAALADPTPEAFGTAMTELARDPERRKMLAVQARQFIHENHTYDVFKESVGVIYPA